MIIFLGAGASRVFGIPTTTEFIDVFEKEIGEENEIYNSIKSSINPDTFDLEVLMTILDDLTKKEDELLRVISPHTSNFLLQQQREKAFHYIKDEGIKNMANDLLSKLKAIIRRECFTAVKDRIDLIMKVYDRFLGVVAKGVPYHTSGDRRSFYPSDMKIFTTNYDTCIETYLNRRQIDFTRGITPRYGYNVFNVDTYNDGEDRVGVFKLHGSIDLFIKDGDIRQFQEYAFEKDGITYLGEEIGNEFIVYPIEASGYQHVIKSPSLDMFRLFRDRIRNNNIWILIGSSFRDLTICSIMNDVLRLKRSGDYPKIIFIDPRAKEIVDGIKNKGFDMLGNTISPIEGKFGDDDIFEVLRQTV